MITLILTLAIIGAILYFIESLPMDATIVMLIRVVVIILVILYLLRFFGVADLPVTRVR